MTSFPEIHGSAGHFDLVRAGAGADLDSAHYDDFMRLVRTLRYGPRTQLVLVEFDDVPYRSRVIEQIDAVAGGVGMTVGSLRMSREIEDVRALEDRLAALAQTCLVIHLIGDETWFDDLDDPRWADLNLRREALFQRVRVRLLFWLTPPRLARLARSAPDLWAWRSGIYDFSRGPRAHVATQPASERRSEGATISLPAAGRRIAELREALQTDAPDDVRLPLLDELASLRQRLGELDEALRIRREQELPVYERLGDVRSVAVTHGKIADVLQARGELDEALRIRREQELPVYERLGDVRSVAVTHGKIADVLQARGELDEALRIRREQELPVYERLGRRTLRRGHARQDRRRAAGPRRTRRSAAHPPRTELPVYERLGDVRSVAVTHGKIADVLQARGELDEALRIRREQELPVYERLGDVRSVAITHGKIADVLQARGELDEALRIRREQELPVYERLGDVREAAIAQAKIALILDGQGHRDDAIALLEAAQAQARRPGLAVAEQIGQLLDAARSRR